MNRNAIPEGLMLVHGNRSERLRDLLVEWIRRHPLAPLETETILVQSNGIAQWLKLALAGTPRAPGESADGGAGGVGIAAALDVTLPARFIWQAYRAVLGMDAVAEVSPFDKTRLVWRLMRLLPALIGEPVFAPLERFIRHDDDRRKRFQLAERIADLFDQYQMYRADWLAAWAAGDDTLPGMRLEPNLLPDEQRWQPALWRAMVADVAAQEAARLDAAAADDADAVARIASRGGRAAVHDAFLQRIAAWPDDGTRPKGLPRRVIVFGMSSLPRQSLEALAAIARWSQVLMCVPNPCAHYWADIVPDKDLLRASEARQRRRAGSPAELAPEQLHLHAQPLLASWGKQGRDFIGLLDEFDSAEAREGYRGQFASIGERIDLFDERDADTLLQQVQDDIRDLRPLPETREVWPPVDPRDDRSIRFHVAHSAQREVEVLHDQLLAAFNADPTLRPRDIIVMVPDIETYAPPIQAVFGLLGRDDPRYIPFSVADRGQRAADPLVGALETLLGLPHARLAVSDLLDLLDVPALRRRFGIEERDLPTLRAWIRGANIRWGLHAEQRASLGLPRDDAPAAPHTWTFGLRRMLLGYAVGSDAAAWREIEPFGEVGGLDATLVGPLVRLIDSLDHAWRTLREPATVDEWCERLRALKQTFFSADDGEDAFTLSRLDNVLHAWLDACSEAGLADALPLSVVAEFWLAQLDEPGLSQRFFAGAVTFATLMPMRAIPFRRVCLLGMNDGDYPRARTPMDFDLMRTHYRPGDRSRREDDRYLLLEALLSARDHLHVSWVGRSINDNTERPPSVLIGQLRDHLAAGWTLGGAHDGDGHALVNALTVHHHLQPFSAAYFPAREHDAGDDTPAHFTYAAEWRTQGPNDDETTAAARVAPLDAPVRDEPLTLRELSDFLRAPVKAFFAQRLRVALDVEAVVEDDEEPFALDALQSWKLQDELIAAQVAAIDDDTALAAARDARLASIGRRGDLATGGFGELARDRLLEPMPRLIEDYRKRLADWPHLVSDEREVSFTTDAQAGGVQRVSGDADPATTLTLADWLGLWRRNDAGREARLLLSSSELVDGRNYRYTHLIAPWVQHLAANLVGDAVTTIIVSKKGTVEFRPLTRDEASTRLADLMHAWALGMRRPLPLAASTAFEWLLRGGRADDASDHAADDAVKAARGKYEGGYNVTGEVGRSASLRRAYPDFAALSASGEFATLAERLLRPLVDAVVRAEKAAKPDKTARSDKPARPAKAAGDQA